MSALDDLLASVAPSAQKEQARSGIPASVIIAQLIQESGVKLSGLARNAKNLFGIKADPSWKGDVYYATTNEVVNGVNQVEVAGFRKYDDYAASFADHTQFLVDNQRYKDIFKTTDPNKVADILQSAGYATDPHYAENLKSLIKDYDLTKYDDPGSEPLWKRILNPLDDARRWLTPDWVEKGWDDVAAGKNPLPDMGTDFLVTPIVKPLQDIKDGLNNLNPLSDKNQTVLKSFFSKTGIFIIVLVLLVGIGFLVKTMLEQKGGG